VAKKKSGLHKKISAIFDGVPWHGHKAPKESPPRIEKADTQNTPSEPVKPFSPIQAPNPPSQPTPVQSAPTAPKEAPHRQHEHAEPKYQPPPREAKLPIREKPKPQKKTKPKVSAAEQAEVRRQRIMMAVVFVLVPVFAWRAFIIFKPFDNSGNSKGSKIPNKAISTIKIDWPDPGSYPANLRDPMKFGRTGLYFRNTGGGGYNPQTGEVDLKGFLFSEDRPVAIIGQEYIGKGEKIPGTGINVIDIDKERGVVKFQNQETKEEWEQKPKSIGR
jgi:hypothetical protein